MDPTKKLKKEIAAHEQLPWELIEEILSRVCPRSLVRFRSVCKRWKAILDDKMFIYNHKETFRFILATKSKIYSVSVDPKIVVREITLDIPGLEAQKPKKLVNCDEFLICGMDKGAAVCNPWLKQSTWISEPSFICYGLGRLVSNGRSEESVYKTIWGKYKQWKIHDLASGTWKDIDSEPSDSNQGEEKLVLHTTSGVFFNGTLIWIVSSNEEAFLYRLFIDFSKEGFFEFCDLPCGVSHRDALVLRVFKGDRFSLLKQCNVTKKIEIWVTKNKINVDDGSDVVWMNLMTFSIPNFPGLVPFAYYYQQPSYFIDKNERLVVCFCDETGKAWIYVMAENKLISKVKIDSVVDPWPLHCTCFPNLVSVPRGLRAHRDHGEEEEVHRQEKGGDFELCPRDTSDPLYSDAPGGDKIFLRVDQNTVNINGFTEEGDNNNSQFHDAPEEEEDNNPLPPHVRKEILELGYPDDGYNYLDHLREIKNTDGGSNLYANPKFEGEYLPRDVKAYDASRVKVSGVVVDDDDKLRYRVASKTVNVIKVKKAIDPEVAALLEGSDGSEFGSDVEDLEEDFVVQANLGQEGEGGSGVSNEEEVEFARPVAENNPRVPRLIDKLFDQLELNEYGSESDDGA
ncbi:F-box domain-containing protein [Hirschfeldia incana]|nr:F-box domain-containing protein [Hirschfeldia incana]